MNAREQIAAILAAQLAGTEAPPAPPVRPRELHPATEATKRRRRARDKRAARRDAVEQLTARVSRAASAAGEPFRPLARIPARTWAMARAVVLDVSGRTASSALATLPAVVRHRARAHLGDTRQLVTRYRAAMLVGLYQLARPSRARRQGRMVVAGYARGALAALLRSPLDGRRLSVSRCYGRAMHAAPIVPWLADRGLLAREQPGRGARGVHRGPSGYALALYYLDGDAQPLQFLDAPSTRGRSGVTVSLAELLARPPD